jgi:integrase
MEYSNPYGSVGGLLDLSHKRSRMSLKARREPYWQRLTAGAFLGFRRGPNTWIVRFRSKATGETGLRRQHYFSLGEALEYDDARERAEAWLAQVSGTAVRTVRRGTVRAALESYLAHLRRVGREEAANRAEGQFKTAIYKKAIALQSLEAVTLDDFLEWRDGLKGNRSGRTIDRLVRAVVAGLNRANRIGHVGNPSAWRLESLPDEKGEDTAIFLSSAQRTGLLSKAEERARAFFHGLELTGARPGELANAVVSDFDGERLRLAHRKGRPPKLRVRYVVLEPCAVELLKRQVEGRRPEMPLFTEDGTRKWRRHIWAEACRNAIAAHNKDCDPEIRIPAGASAYCFRHARISELLQVFGFDPITVAQQTGTSLQMIEKAYFRFIPTEMSKKLAAMRAKSNDNGERQHPMVDSK